MSGNLQTWAHHKPGDFDWPNLPSTYVLQLHWPPTAEFKALLAAHQFRAVAICRHPFDVLLSILHFAAKEADTRNWLDGAGGDESSIRGVSPTSEAFAKYAVSERAKALLGVSRDWWREPGTLRIRYEDWIAEPERHLTEFWKELNWPATAEHIAATVEFSKFSTMQRKSENGHYWQGKPGLWKRLLPTPLLEKLKATHKVTLAVLGYSAEADPLSVAEAEANWAAIA